MDRSHYNLTKILFILTILIYGIFGLKDNQNFLLIDSMDLMFHEFGHLFFFFMPELFVFFAGTMMQLVIPNAFFIYFLVKKSFYSASVILFWVAINLFDISIYIKDARTMNSIPLIPGTTHDWNYILTRLNLLNYDQVIGNLIFSIGIIFFALSIILGIYFSKTNQATDKLI